MISKEEVLVALKALYPDGIPDACGTVMAHEDAPFKSYQELRKILGRTSAWGNRRNWKHLLDGADSVEPPKPKLKFNVEVSPEELTEEGSSATFKLNVLEGEYLENTVNFDVKFSPEINQDTNPLRVEFYAFDESTNTMVMTYIALGNSPSTALVTVTAEDKNYPGTIVSSPMASVYIDAPIETKISWELSDNKLTTKGAEIFALFSVDAGKEPKLVWLDVPDGLPPEQARLLDIQRIENESRISIKCTELAEENLTIPLTLYGADSEQDSPVSYGTKPVTISQKTDDKLEITWSQDKTEADKKGDSVLVTANVIAGEYSPGTLGVDLVNSADADFVSVGVKLGDNPIPLTVNKIPGVGEPDKVVKFYVAATDKNYPSKGKQTFGEQGSITIKAEQGEELPK